MALLAYAVKAHHNEFMRTCITRFVTKRSSIYNEVPKMHMCHHPDFQHFVFRLGLGLLKGMKILSHSLTYALPIDDGNRDFVIDELLSLSRNNLAQVNLCMGK